MTIFCLKEPLSFPGSAVHLIKYFPLCIQFQFERINRVIIVQGIQNFNSCKGKVVPVLNLIKHYAMKAYGGVDV
jgi:hypothetical protein